MKTARESHGSVYFEGFLYVIGGCNPRYLAECERYDSSLNKWEDIAPMPQASSNHQTIVCEDTRRIHTLGGKNDTGLLDLIQEFDLHSQTWRVLDVKLQFKSELIPSFTVKNQAEIFFIQGGAVYSFNSLTYAITQVKAITNITSSHGPSYYAKGTLYYPNGSGPLQKLELDRA
jgi:hypothetical protein